MALLAVAGEGDLAHFLETRSDLHFALLNDTVRRWSSPGVAGAWLPLCSQTLMGCAPGHFATPYSTPSLSCSAQGPHYGVCPHGVRLKIQVGMTFELGKVAGNG